MREETWFDRAGDFHSDALHVVERYTPLSPYHLMYEATIEDPKVFTRPWKISFPLYRRMEKNIQLLEFKCVPFTEELLYGELRKRRRRNERHRFFTLLAVVAVVIAVLRACRGQAPAAGRLLRRKAKPAAKTRSAAHALGRSGSPGRLERRHQHAAATALRGRLEAGVERRGSGRIPGSSWPTA